MTKEMYEQALIIYKDKEPNLSHLARFNLVVNTKINGTTIYTCNDFNITETYDNNKMLYYSLSNNEILSVLTYYNITKLKINILHYRLLEIQAYTDGNILCLKIPAIRLLEKYNMTDRELSLKILLHEISHILGNNEQSKACEDEADRFALVELHKWKKIIEVN